MAVKFSLWIMTPLIFGLLILSQWLIPLVLGSGFIEAINVFRIYLVGTLILAVFTTYDHVLFATNNHRSIVKINFVTTLILFLLGWLLIPVWGGVGAAGANAVTWLVGGTWQFLILRQKTGIRFLSNWRLTRSEVKYLHWLFNSFGQAVVRFGRKATC